MIRIGFSRWQTIFENKPLPMGLVEMSVKLLPHAKAYRVPYQKWSGLRNASEIKSVPTKSFITSLTFERFTKIGTIVSQLKIAVAGLSAEVVQFCLNNDIANHNSVELKETISLVNSALMKLIETGTSDVEESPVDEVDLVAELLAVEQAQQIRRIGNYNLSNEQHVEAVKKSFEFLNYFLNDTEKEMLFNNKCIRISNTKGDFYIYPYDYELVHQFKSGKYIQSHCVVFKDYSLPKGDETAMKVVLLKTDIERFMNVSNKFQRSGIKEPILRLA